jgi:hypothetical protein
VFGGDQAFVGALDKACTAVINHRSIKLPPNGFSQPWFRIRTWTRSEFFGEAGFGSAGSAC